MAKKEKIAHDNGLFMILMVGMCLGMGYFSNEILNCRFEKFAQFPTDNAGAPGYIRVDYTAIKELGRDHQEVFEQQVQNGLFEKLSYGFSSRTEFEGDLNEKTTIKRDGYEFLFHIKEYERDSAHGFEMVGPEELCNIPEEEELGRMVYITVKLEKV